MERVCVHLSAPLRANAIAVSPGRNALGAVDMATLGDCRVSQHQAADATLVIFLHGVDKPSQGVACHFKNQTSLSDNKKTNRSSQI